MKGFFVPECGEMYPKNMNSLGGPKIILIDSQYESIVLDAIIV